MSQFEFRQAKEEDAEYILCIMAQAFERTPGSKKYTHDKERLAREIETHWVLAREGTAVGAVHIQKEAIQVGRSVVTKADVGEVCIAPCYQGEGLGTTLMQMTVAQLKADRYPLSRLGGYRRFYERFGWVPFPRGHIDFPLQGLTSRGGFTDPICYLDRPEEDVHIRTYNGLQDATTCKALYTAFNAKRTGAVPERSFGSGAENPWWVVYEKNGTVQAYVFASQSAPPYTRFSTAVSISDAACNPQNTQPLGETLRYILRQAAIAKAESVKARLPLDPSLYNLYRDASCGFIPSLWQSSEGGNMLQVLSLKDLLETIVLTLEERLQAAKQTACEVVLQVREETVGVIWDGKKVNISKRKKAGVVLGQDEIMKMVLGLTPVEQILQEQTESAAFLKAAFPMQGTATGVWG